MSPWPIQSMKFFRSEYWSGQPFPSPGDLSNSGIEPRSPALQADPLPAEPTGKTKSESFSCSVIFVSHGIFQSWNSLGKNTSVDNHSLLQEIFLTLGSNSGPCIAGRFITV